MQLLSGQTLEMVTQPQVCRGRPIGRVWAFRDRTELVNADRREVLQAAGLARARAVVITYPDTHSAERALRIVRQTRPEIPVVIRTADDKDTGRLKAAGATEVIPEVLEGSLLIAAETLVQAGIPMSQAIQHVRAARAERYSSLRDFYEPDRGHKGKKKS